MWKSGLILKEKSVKLLDKELLESQNKNYIAELLFHILWTQTISFNSDLHFSNWLMFQWIMGLFYCIWNVLF